MAHVHLGHGVLISLTMAPVHLGHGVLISPIMAPDHPGYGALVSPILLCPLLYALYTLNHESFTLAVNYYSTSHVSENQFRGSELDKCHIRNLV